MEHRCHRGWHPAGLLPDGRQFLSQEKQPLCLEKRAVFQGHKRIKQMLPVQNRWHPGRRSRSISAEHPARQFL